MKPPLLTFAQFEVQGDTDTYVVSYDCDDGWYCTCPDYHYRKHACKHIRSSRKLIKKLIQEKVPDDQEKLVV